ncbi:MAG: histidine phosphatase family protein, partial [Paramuribaculum sp.]|nr:histidine phosphatase family protein [Paramuribaculum sp.]
MKHLILLRHGQSRWNLENRFTGWADVPLTDEGRREAHIAGELMLKAGLPPDAAFTSYLR